MRRRNTFPTAGNNRPGPRAELGPGPIHSMIFFVACPGHRPCGSLFRACRLTPRMNLLIYGYKDVLFPFSLGRSITRLAHLTKSFPSQSTTLLPFLFSIIKPLFSFMYMSQNNHGTKRSGFRRKLLAKLSMFGNAQSLFSRASRSSPHE